MRLVNENLKCLKKHKRESRLSKIHLNISFTLMWPFEINILNGNHFVLLGIMEELRFNN